MSKRSVCLEKLGMRFFRKVNVARHGARTEILSLALATVILMPLQSQAEERLQIDLNNTLSVDEINRELEKRPRPERQEETFYFGFDLRSGPLEDARQYLPFLNYLNRTTGYRFKLRFMPDDVSITDALGSGEIHFAAIGAVSFVLAHEKYGVVSLARGINSLGKSEYQSIIVVSPDSQIQNVSDLRGKRFAFGSTTSTQGHLIPRIILAEQGLSLDDFSNFSYTGSHRDCANTVIMGTFDACGMQDTLARSMADEGLVKILHTSSYYPSSGVSANKDVSRTALDKVRQALLDFDPQGRDSESLHDWQKTEMPRGFEASDPTDYSDLQRWLIDLGIMNKTGETPVEGAQQ